jgi:hypothetical protein
MLFRDFLCNNRKVSPYGYKKPPEMVAFFVIYFFKFDGNNRGIYFVPVYARAIFCSFGSKTVILNEFDEYTKVYDASDFYGG